MTRDIRDRVAEGLLAMLPVFQKFIFRSRSANPGFRIAQYRALDILIRSGPLSMSELGRLLCVSKPSMTQLANSLVENGWAERRACCEDRRIVHIAIVPAGKKHLRKAFDDYRADVTNLLDDLGTADLERMAAALEELERIFSKLGEEH